MGAIGWEKLVFVDFHVGEDVGEGHWRFLGKGHVGRGGEGTGGEGVGAMVKHLLRKVVGVDVGLDAQVAEHGVGFPAAQQLDGVLVDVGAEESGGSAGAEAAGGQECWVDAECVVEVVCAVPEASSDPLGRHGSEFVGGVVVVAESGIRWCVV